MLLRKRAGCFETFCSEQQNQSNVYIPTHSKSPEKDRLSSREEHQLRVLSNAEQQPAANSDEDGV